MSKAANPLVGKWFHQLDDKGLVERQGQVIGFVTADCVLVEHYDFITGSPCLYKVLPVSEMRAHVFYDSDVHMRESNASRRTERAICDDIGDDISQALSTR